MNVMIKIQFLFLVDKNNAAFAMGIISVCLYQEMGHSFCLYGA